MSGNLLQKIISRNDRVRCLNYSSKSFFPSIAAPSFRRIGTAVKNGVVEIINEAARHSPQQPNFTHAQESTLKQYHVRVPNRSNPRQESKPTVGETLDRYFPSPLTQPGLKRKQTITVRYIVETIDQGNESHGNGFNATHFSMEGLLHEHRDNDFLCRAPGRGYCERRATEVHSSEAGEIIYFAHVKRLNLHDRAP
jgi:hypothetical protein